MRKRILVVDDVSDWRATLRDILKQVEELEVKTVDNYQEAVEVIRNREVELAIVDLRLSPTDESNRQGMELLKQLAEHRINAIVLTGYPEQELKEEAEEKYKIFEFVDKGQLAKNGQYLLELVREAFDLMESKEKVKQQMIRVASTLQSVSFSKDLASWPLRQYRKK